MAEFFASLCCKADEGDVVKQHNVFFYIKIIVSKLLQDTPKLLLLINSI